MLDVLNNGLKLVNEFLSFSSIEVLTVNHCHQFR